MFVTPLVRDFLKKKFIQHPKLVVVPSFVGENLEIEIWNIEETKVLFRFQISPADQMDFCARNLNLLKKVVSA